MGLTIKLERAELVRAATAGVEREIDAILNKRTPQLGQGDVWAHMLGAMSELAVAKWRGREWVPLHDNPTGKADVGRNVEVRCSQYPDAHLIVREKDRDDRPFVLVVPDPPWFQVRGWLWGREAKVEKYRREDAYWVPQRDLREVP